MIGVLIETPEIILAVIGFTALWLATLAWNFISLMAVIHCWKMYALKREAFQEVKHHSSDAWVFIYAEDRLRKASWFLWGFVLNLLVGVYSLAILIISSYVVLPDAFRPPVPDTSINTAIIRGLIVGAIFCLWQAKRIDLVHEYHVQELLDQEYRANTGKEFKKKPKILTEEDQEPSVPAEQDQKHNT